MAKTFIRSELDYIEGQLSKISERDAHEALRMMRQVAAGFGFTNAVKNITLNDIVQMGLSLTEKRD